MAYGFGIDHGTETLDHVPEFKARLDSIVAASKSVTFVGWRPEYDGDPYHVFRWLRQEGERLTMVVEAWRPNFDAFIPPYRSCFKFYGDIRIAIAAIPMWARDCFIWQDGPEHLDGAAGRHLISNLQYSYNSIVLATPNGWMEQGAFNGNPYECHLSAWTPETYTTLGFECVEYRSGLVGLWERK